MLHVDIFKALELPEHKLQLLYNESRRQRGLDLINNAKAFNPSGSMDEIDDLMAIHGDYTDGFYDNELNRLFRDFKS